MKHCLLSVSAMESVNIGDYIQALAASQFLPAVDGFVERETLKDYSGEPCKVIMNGWYMHHPDQWPPSEKIIPLFVAFHINVAVKDKFLAGESIAYLKKYEPIGCRDEGTVRYLLSKGVNAYFSGCLTLTLGLKYGIGNSHRGGVYFTDPVVQFRSKARKVWWLLRSVLNFGKIKIIAGKYNAGEDSLLQRYAFASKFFYYYRKLFSESTLLEAEYISHSSRAYKDNYSSDLERLEKAKELVECYANARLVVTSRIHCALPCLGLETPVLFLFDDNQKEVSSCRFGGLTQFFNIIEVGSRGLTPGDWFSKTKVGQRICAANAPANKTNWKQYAGKLAERCFSFVEGDRL